ncbi:hypothetical protein LXA43DRAFT_1187918 [Ganoderma leucocontextum]|nr:hypothetical protein LXA43DRAFT_1187918 [Ganoderma leucocontextum]
MASPGDASPPPLRGPINKSRKKAELEAIAGALEIRSDKKTSVVNLAKATNSHLEKNPNLANEARFQGLFAYRSNNTIGGRKASRTSGDKAAEDAAEAEKPAKAPTGAHKKLVDWDLPRDPPPRTTRLNKGPTSAPVVELEKTGPTPIAMESGPSSGGDAETPATPYDMVEDEELEVTEQQEDKTNQGTGTLRGRESVVVLLERPGGLHSKPEIEEVHIPPDAGLKVEHRVEGGQKAAFTKLSQLLPIALAYASTPTKKKGGRLTCMGATKDGSHAPLGSIEAILAGPEAEPSRYLKSTQVDSYRLDRRKGDGNSDLLVCHLFVQPTDDGVQAPQPLKAQVTAPSSRSGSMQAGRGTTSRSGGSSMSRSRNGSDKEGLVAYLRGLLDGPDGPWKKAKRVGDILPRVKAVERAMESLEDLGWEQPKGGYLIPKDYSDAEDFAGWSFIKEDVLAALQLGHSQAAGDALLFKAEVMRKLPTLQAWYDEPDGDEASKFSTMTIPAFKQWQKEELKNIWKTVIH